MTEQDFLWRMKTVWIIGILCMIANVVAAGIAAFVSARVWPVPVRLEEEPSPRMALSAAAALDLGGSTGVAAMEGL